MWPLVSFECLAAFVFLMSSIAHTFCVMSPKMLGFQIHSHCKHQVSSNVHDLLFLLDFAGISMLMVGAGQGYFFYSGTSVSPITLYDSPSIFFTVSLVISSFATYLTGISMLTKVSNNSLFAVASFALPYVFSTSPFVHKLYKKENESIGDKALTSMFHRQFFYFLVGALVHAIKIPERFAPGKFDFIGNSHNLMHIFTALGIFQTNSLFVEELSMRDYQPIPGIAIWNKFGVLLLCIVSNVTVAGLLFLRRYRKIK